MTKITSVSSGWYGEYLLREVAESCYWEGQGSRLLGIEHKAIAVEDWSKIEAGLHPVSGEVLRERAGRVGSKGVYDLTISAPKSLSLMALVSPEVLEAHREGVRYVSALVEGMVRVKDQRDYRHSFTPSGNVLLGPVEHRVSRSLDPQVHTHVAVMNLTQDPRDGRWKSIQMYPVFQAQRDLTQAYRWVMGQRLERSGYTLDGPEIAGVTSELRARFSRRSTERQEEIQRYQGMKGPASPKMRNWLTQDSRPEKQLVPLDRAQGMALERLLPEELGILHRIETQAIERRGWITIDVPPGQYRWVPVDQVTAPIRLLKGHAGEGEGLLKPDPDDLKKARTMGVPRQEQAWEKPLQQWEWTYGAEGRQKGIRR